jgi:hypothetical protein
MPTVSVDKERFYASLGRQYSAWRQAVAAARRAC